MALKNLDARIPGATRTEAGHVLASTEQLCMVPNYHWMLGFE